MGTGPARQRMRLVPRTDWNGCNFELLEVEQWVST